MRDLIRGLLPTAHLIVAGAVLLWDVLLAGRIARSRRAPRAFTSISALAALLVAPAMVLAVATSSLYGGRAVEGVAWIWPLTTVLFAVQAGYALVRKLVTRAIVFPIFVYDLLLAAVATTSYLLQVRGHAPMPMLALLAAHTNVLGQTMGRAALYSPLALQVPMIAPAFPARWRASATVRAALALLAAISTAFTLLELPRGFGIVRSYDAYMGEQLQERPAGDFAVGLRLFPDLGDVPQPAVLRNDLALLDTADVDVVSVVLRPDGVRNLALDSLAHALDDLRTDSTLLVVSLAFGSGDRARALRSPSELADSRIRLVDRIARRLRPDYLLPAVEPYGESVRTVGALPLEWWRSYLTRAANTAHGVNRRIRVGVSAGSYDARDSALYAWAASRRSPLDVVGFSVWPSLNGAPGVDARLRAADRWMQAASANGGVRKENWIFSAGGFPQAHGERSQDRAAWHVMSWATTRPQLRGVIISDPGDYTRMTGVRAATGRLRRVIISIGRAARGLRENVIR